jgi:hypothetical protein
MKKKYLLPILLCLPGIIWGAYVIASWQNVGNSLQRSNDTFNFRTDMGSNRGFVYWYQKSQVDSLFLNVPTISISDSSLKPVNSETMHQFSYSLTTFFDTSKFAGSGGFGVPITLRTNFIQDTLRILNQPTNIYDVVRLNDILLSNEITFPGETTSLSNAGTYLNADLVDRTFIIGAYLNIDNITGNDSIIVQYTWIDTNSATKTKTFYVMGDSFGTTYNIKDDYSFPTALIRVKAGSTIQFSSTVTGSGTILYDLTTIIDKKKGNGGL